MIKDNDLAWMRMADAEVAARIDAAQPKPDGWDELVTAATEAVAQVDQMRMCVPYASPYPTRASHAR
jgi:hypothetical protein